DSQTPLVEGYRHREKSTFYTPQDLAAALARVDQLGLTARDLEPFIGSSGRVSEVLNHKRKLSLAMIKRLHEGLRIPYEQLLAGV
ncbi:transcriptional regulator, partial [Salmonella enterica subsp. enterica]